MPGSANELLLPLARKCTSATTLSEADLDLSLHCDDQASKICLDKSFDNPIHNKQCKGAIVPIDVTQKLEIDATEYVDCTIPKRFAFHRQARKSKIMRFGINEKDASESAELLEPYTKATEKMASTMYMSIVIGSGSLGMPSVFADCGLLPGLMVMIVGIVVHVFMAHRLIDIPELVGRANLEGFGDIGSTLFYKFVWRLTQFLTVAMWFNSCVLFFYILVYYLVPVICYLHLEIKSEVWCGILEAGMMFFMIPLTLRTDAKRLRYSATCSFRAMWMLFLVVAIAGIVHGVQHWSSNSYSLFLPLVRRASATSVVKSGAAELLLRGWKVVSQCYGGLAILPYIVSDMMQPDKAKDMVNRSAWQIMVFFLGIGLIGYFGWGAAVQDNIMTSMLFADTPKGSAIAYSSFYWWMAQLLSVAVVIKCISTFPMWVWPLFRELDLYFEPGNSAAVTLGLPWALRNLRRSKLRHRCFLCLLIFVIRRSCPHWRIIQPLLTTPLRLCESVLLPIFAVFAIWHRIFHPSQQSNSGAQEEKRMFGDRIGHLIITVGVGLFSVALGFLICNSGLRAGYEELLSRMRKPSYVPTCQCFKVTSL